MENTIYFADQIHMPYGPRPKQEIEEFCARITKFLIQRGCKAIVIACNTASAAALKTIREAYPGFTIIGMEPAVKPAAATTKNKIVGILATPTTLKGNLYSATVKRHAIGIHLVEQACGGLAELIEGGAIAGSELNSLLQTYLNPILEANTDTLVLACTHYPFAIDAIRKIVGNSMNIIDPAPAIARHLEDLLRVKSILAFENKIASHTFFTSGDVARFEYFLNSLLGRPYPAQLARL